MLCLTCFPLLTNVGYIEFQPHRPWETAIRGCSNPMTVIFQIFLQFLVSVLASTAVCVICAIWLLSSGIPAPPFGVIKNPISTSALVGLVIGISHGLLTGLMIFWFKPTSILSATVSSVLATEVLIIVGFIVCWVAYTEGPVFGGANSTEILAAVWIFVVNLFIYLILLSFFALVPSIVIGLLNRLVAGLLSKFN